MRILVVNGNTTQAITELALGEARRAASPGTEIEGVTARLGAAFVSNAAHDVIAAQTDVGAVVICGAALTGIARRLQPPVCVPLLDGIACGVRQAESLMRADFPLGFRPAPGPASGVTGVDPEFTALFAASQTSKED